MADNSFRIHSQLSAGRPRPCLGDFGTGLDGLRARSVRVSAKAFINLRIQRCAVSPRESASSPRIRGLKHQRDVWSRSQRANRSVARRCILLCFSRRRQLKELVTQREANAGAPRRKVLCARWSDSSSSPSSGVLDRGTACAIGVCVSGRRHGAPQDRDSRGAAGAASQARARWYSKLSLSLSSRTHTSLRWKGKVPPLIYIQTRSKPAVLVARRASARRGHERASAGVPRPEPMEFRTCDC